MIQKTPQDYKFEVLQLVLNTFYYSDSWSFSAKKDEESKTKEPPLTPEELIEIAEKFYGFVSK